MTDKMERAVQASNLLEHGLFAEVLKALEEDYLSQWRWSRSTEERESIYHRIAVLDRIKQDLRSIITTGEIEDNTQTMREKLHGNG